MIEKKKTISKVKAAENIKAFRRELREHGIDWFTIKEINEKD